MNHTHHNNGFTQHCFFKWRNAVLKNDAGFTLIEMLVYLGLFALIMTGAFVGAYQLIEHSVRTQAHVERSEELGFILRKITWMLGSASSVSVSEGGHQLTVEAPFGTFHFEHDDGVLMVNDEPLSSNRVSVSDFYTLYEPSSGHVSVGVTVGETDAATTTVYLP